MKHNFQIGDNIQTGEISVGTNFDIINVLGDIITIWCTHGNWTGDFDVVRNKIRFANSKQWRECNHQFRVLSSHPRPRPKHLYYAPSATESLSAYTWNDTTVRSVEIIHETSENASAVEIALAPGKNSISLTAADVEQLTRYFESVRDKALHDL